MDLLNPGMMLVLGVIAVLLFGERLPEAAKTFGKKFWRLRKVSRLSKTSFVQPPVPPLPRFRPACLPTQLPAARPVQRRIPPRTTNRIGTWPPLPSSCPRRPSPRCMRPICKPVYAVREAVDVSPEGASVRPAKGEALVQRPHQTLFCFRQRPAQRAKSSSSIPHVHRSSIQANSWPVGPNTARHRI